MKTRFADLILDNGELVRIEVPEKFEDEFFDSIENEMKVGGWWSPARFENCTATYLGNSIARVNMGKVVAML